MGDTFCEICGQAKSTDEVTRVEVEPANRFKNARFGFVCGRCYPTWEKARESVPTTWGSIYTYGGIALCVLFAARFLVGCLR
jgi:hypothetical protein